MRIKYLVGISSLVVSLLLIGILGCGVTVSVIQKTTPDNSSLKKRVLVLPLVDQADLPPVWTTQIAENMIERLKKSPRLLPFVLPKDQDLPSWPEPTGFGVVNPPDLIKMARDMNMNVLITGILNPIEATEKTKGWPLRKELKVYAISMFINVVDVADGCLCLNKLVSRDVTFPLKKTKNTSKTELIDQALKKAMPQILKEQCSAITEKLKGVPWTGRILAVNNGAIKINAGNDAGIRPNQVFTVYSKGESITCLSGKSVELLGQKAGEIKATSIMEDSAMAESVSGGPFLAGQIIRLSP